MQMTTVNAGDARTAAESAESAAKIFRAGGLVVFPTETVYGVGAIATSEKGVKALRDLKTRPSASPFAVHMPGPGAAAKYVDTSIPLVKRLVRKLLPGPVTLVVDVAPEVIEQKLRDLGLPMEAADRIYHANTVGLRSPDHALGQQILGSVDEPVIASSANLRGEAPPLEAIQSAKSIGDKVGMIVDGGMTQYAKASTVVLVKGTDAASATMTIAREGVYDERFIRKIMRWNLLIVCSGNTCRSPMAEVIARDILAKQRGVDIDQLEEAGVSVTSAGSMAMPGSPAADQAQQAMEKMGLNLNSHRSRPLTVELINEADVVYCLTESHRAGVLAMSPNADQKTVLLDPSGDIDDPFGADLKTYQRCAEVIRRCLQKRLKEQQP